MNIDIIIKSAGEIASGVAHRLIKCGFRVICLEQKQPTVIRQKVAFATSVYTGTVEIEGIKGKLVNNISDALSSDGWLPVLIDPAWESIKIIKPQVIIDAILAKKNLGTYKDDAELVIALGPGFSAPDEVDYVIETNRGHNLGRIIEKGKASDNTGIPGEIKGESSKRVIRAPIAGIFHPLRKIGDSVKKGDKIIEIHQGEQIIPVFANLDGIIRGLLWSGLRVPKRMKLGDIDPRNEINSVHTLSDKARTISGSVLAIIIRKLFSFK